MSDAVINKTEQNSAIVSVVSEVNGHSGLASLHTHTYSLYWPSYSPTSWVKLAERK